MKIIIKLIIAAAAIAICGMTYAQSLEEQFKSADAELNRVYKELRSKLNEQQKAELKNLQMAWLKEVYKIADQPREAQQYLTTAEQRNKFLAEATRTRTNFLKDLFQKITGVSFLQHEFQLTQTEFKKADDELNRIYQKLKAQLTQGEFDKLKNDQKKWLISFNKLSSNDEGSFYDKRVALEKKIHITQLRTAELKERILVNKSDADKNWEELSRIEEAKFSKEFGLKPVYQNAAYNSENIVAEAENGKYRAISLSNSNRIYVFDINSKLLMGECEVWGGLMEGVATKIQFTEGGQYIYAEKVGFRGMDHCFFHVPSLLLASFTSSDRELALAPLSADGGYTGIASSRFHPQDLLERNGFLFRDDISDYSNPINGNEAGSDFLRYFPIAASRIGFFI
jgi:uncharacterized protein YecT (DUF1311 family)